jgi:hypothetical protein
MLPIIIVYFFFVFCRCIDGYSRRIIWLKCSYSNHDPKLVAGYYMDAVDELGGCPSSVRTDCGSENVMIAAIQCYFRNSRRAHAYGTSPGNQRIEAWWSFFRRSRVQWWIDLFEALVTSGSYEPGHLRQTDCLRFSFMNLIQNDLVLVVHQWNTHRIRPSIGARCPPGVPEELYVLPQPPAVDCLVVAHPELPPNIRGCIQKPRLCADEIFAQYLLYLCQFHNWSAPNNTDDAVRLYHRLLQFI